MAQTQIGYSKTVMDHFMNPRNVGVIESPDGYGRVGNLVCGDLMEIFITVKDEQDRGHQVSHLRLRVGHCRLQHGD